MILFTKQSHLSQICHKQNHPDQVVFEAFEIAGIRLLNRELYITTHGTAVDIFTDNEIDSLLSIMQDYITDGNYYDAFIAFADECELTLIDYNTVGVSFIWIPICLAVGFVIALIITAIRASSLKSVRRKVNAVNYVRQGSLVLTGQQDIFLYSNIQRSPVQRNNTSSSTHTSSSGRTHGGGGSSF